MNSLNSLIAELQARIAEFEREILRHPRGARRAYWNNRLDHARGVLARAQGAAPKPPVLVLSGEDVRIDITEDAPGTARVFGGLS